MIYVKHPALGNRHVTEAEYETMRSQGWVKWPRSAAEKNAAPLSSPPPVSIPEAGAAPDLKAQFDEFRSSLPPSIDVEAITNLILPKRKPGRPKK